MKKAHKKKTMWKMHPNRGLVSLLSMHFRRVALFPQSLHQWRSAASPGASKTETSQGQVRQSEQSGAVAGPGTRAPRRPHYYNSWQARHRHHCVFAAVVMATGCLKLLLGSLNPLERYRTILHYIASNIIFVKDAYSNT